MKKLLILALIGAFAWNLSFANESLTGKRQAIISGLITQLDTNIKWNPELVDHYLSTVQNIYGQQKSDLKKALEDNNTQEVKRITQDWELIRQVGNHLYKVKGEQNQKEIWFSGSMYRFKSQVMMPWLSISRGDKDYFAFPSKDSYVQLNWSQNVSGAVRNLIAAEYEGKEYLPKYYYAGGYSLQDLAGSTSGTKIGSNNGEDRDSYLFFDLPIQQEHQLKNLNFKLWSTTIKGDTLYIQPTFSPIYEKKASTPGFSFCEAVAKRKGDQSATKEYWEEECEKAANAETTPDMHPDLLEYLDYLSTSKKSA